MKYCGKGAITDSNSITLKIGQLDKVFSQTVTTGLPVTR